MIKNKLGTKRNKNKRNEKGTRKKMKGAGGLCKAPVKTSNFLKNNYSIKNEFASSTWHIYSDVKNPNILIKKIGPVKWLDAEEIEKELRITQKASDLGVGPLVHYWCIEKTNNGSIGYLVMDKIDGDGLDTLLNSSKSDTKKIMEEVHLLLDKLYDNGIKHNDRFPSNFIYGTTQTEPTKRLWIIDYGNVKEYNSPVAMDKREYYFFD